MVPGFEPTTFKHESQPIITRPGLPPVAANHTNNLYIGVQAKGYSFYYSFGKKIDHIASIKLPTGAVLKKILFLHI